MNFSPHKKIPIPRKGKPDPGCLSIITTKKTHKTNYAMKRHLTRSILTFAVLGLAIYQAGASEVKDQAHEDSLLWRPFQISFITPMGTNGLESGQVTNRLSVNIIAGYAGGLEGIEVGGMINTIHRNAFGAQFAGFANLVGGSIRGVQFAGYANVVLEQMQGGQFAGFSNVSLGTFDGIQASGFANFVNADLKGIQVSGFSGVVNGNTHGAQIGGFANITTGKTDGLQLSSFLNYTKALNGTQIGLFNYTDSIGKGLSIGFLSIVRNGVHQLVVGGNESLYATVSFKTGTRAFYNILSVGAKPTNARALWAYGYGIGSAFALGKKTGMHLEGISYQIHEINEYQTRLNLLNKLSLGVEYRINDKLVMAAGPSFNVLVSDIRDEENISRSSAIAPFTIFDQTYTNTNIKMYPGLSLEIGFF